MSERVCTLCRGTGELGDMTRELSLPRICPECEGTGEELETCTACEVRYPPHEINQVGLCVDCARYFAQLEGK